MKRGTRGKAAAGVAVAEGDTATMVLDAEEEEERPSPARRLRRSTEVPDWGYSTDTMLLTREEESELLIQAQGGDEFARERLIQANLRLVFSIVRRYHCRHLTQEDLVQEGIIGLMVAIQRFDSSRNCRLSTYATHWIRQAIARSIEQHDRLIRLPVHASSELRQVQKATHMLRQELQREPDAEELASACGLAVERVCHLRESIQEPVSLEMLVGEDQDVNLLDLTLDQSSPSPEDGTMHDANMSMLEDLLGILRPRERKVIEQRYGFGGIRPSSLQELSEELEISREGVRQIEARALKKLRRAWRSSQWD